DDLRGRIDRVRLEPLDGVERGQLARIIRRLEIGELVLGLLTEIAAVYEEENALGVGEFEQAIGYVDCGEGLARSCSHLDQRAPIGPAEGLVEITNRAGLNVPQPSLVECRELLEPRAELHWLRHPPGQRLG